MAPPDARSNVHILVHGVLEEVKTKVLKEIISAWD